MLEKISKLEGEDASSEEAKEVLKFKDQLKAASGGEGGEWTEPVDDGCMEIFQQVERWERDCKELKMDERDVREIEGMSQYVATKWTAMPKMKKLADAVLERTKPLIEAAKKAHKDKEQSGVLSELKFTQSLVDGTIATYGMLGFTVPHFIISGTATPCEQVESKLKKFEEGLAIDPESELGKELAAGIEKLKGLMPQMQLICKENPREEMKEAADYKETIRLKGTLMAASACAIKENKEELSKMIEIWQEFRLGEPELGICQWFVFGRSSWRLCMTLHLDVLGRTWMCALMSVLTRVLGLWSSCCGCEGYGLRFSVRREFVAGDSID